MPWLYSRDASTPPDETYNPSSTGNYYNQIAAPVILPVNGAVTKFKVWCGKYENDLTVRFVLWEAGGDAVKQGASRNLGSSPNWITETLAVGKALTAGTYWMGLYANPEGDWYYVGVSESGYPGYKKKNSSTWPNPISMSSAVILTHQPYVGIFYVTIPEVVTGLTVEYQDVLGIYDQITVDWVNHPTDDQPYTKIYVQRWDNVTNDWYTIVTLTSGSVYVDDSVSKNRTYKYRVKAWNYAGDSAYVTSADIVTPPSKPTTVVGVQQSSADVKVTWVNPAQNETAVRIQSIPSLTGGYSWTDLAVLPANSVEYLHEDVPGTQIYYRVRNESTDANGTLYSDYTESSVVTLWTGAGTAPTNLNPTSSVYRSWTDNDTEISLTWETVRDQYKYSLRYRAQGEEWPGTPQVNDTIDSTKEYLLGIDDVTTEQIIEWQVKYRDFASYETDWSSIATFKIQKIPSVAITVPSVANYESSTLVCEYIYSQIDSELMIQVVGKLYDENDVLLETVEEISGTLGTGETGYLTFTTILEHAHTYKVVLKVKDDNFWSAETEQEFTTAFDLPHIPELTLEADLDNASVILSIVNASPGVGEVEAISNNIYRSVDGGLTYQLVTNVDINTTVVDYLPLLNGITYYYVEAVSETNTSVISSIANINIGMTGCYALNSVLLKGDTSFGEKINTDVVLKQFEGRIYPVKFQGPSRDQEIDFSCDLPFDSYQDLKDLIEGSEDIYYRDCKNRWFLCAVTNCKFDKKDNESYQFGCTITRIEGE